MKVEPGQGTGKEEMDLRGGLSSSLAAAVVVVSVGVAIETMEPSSSDSRTRSGLNDFKAMTMKYRPVLSESIEERCVGRRGFSWKEEMKMDLPLENMEMA